MAKLRDKWIEEPQKQLVAQETSGNTPAMLVAQETSGNTPAMLVAQETSGNTPAMLVTRGQIYVTLQQGCPMTSKKPASKKTTQKKQISKSKN